MGAKWLIFGILVAFVRYGNGGALRCTPASQDPSCLAEFNAAASIQTEDDPVSTETETPEAECLAGSEWESNCHRCRCSESGAAQCKKLDGCDSGKPIRCKPDTTFTRDCNTCLCLKGGLVQCTLKNCRRSGFPKKSELPSGKECAPGTSWKSQCNDCGCTENGHSYCTEKGCLGQEFEPILRCAPDSIWKNDCNMCWCTAEGLPMCTKMGCVSDINIEEATTSAPLAQADVNRVNQEEEPEAGTPNLEEKKANFDSKGVEDLEIAESYYDVHKDIPKVGIYNEKPQDEFRVNDLNYAEDKLSKSKGRKIKRSVCKPNQPFQSECNACKCAPDGQSYSCTHNECMDGETNKEVEVFMENEGSDHIERHSVCKPRGTFYIGCNTCHCDYYGTDYSCTNKPCPLPEDVEVFHELKTKSATNKTSKIVCEANRMFIKDCNTCWCNEDGTRFFCTRKVCVAELPDDVQEEGNKDLRVIIKECRPDEVFELDCNMCRCNPDGKSFSCTRRTCVDPLDEDTKNNTLSRKTRGAQEPTKACTPAQEFRKDCNKCLCDIDGMTFSCTRNDCVALNNNHGTRRKRETEEIAMECVAGSVFDKDCNVCRCSDGHHAVCTVRVCGKGADVKPVQESDPNFRCNPGEQFKRNCNDCSCSADGKSYFCTVRFCDQDSTPPPSS